jgi:Mrp family chromosome partitioning ATPase
MSEVLSRLAKRYDLVVLDTAPLGVVADAFPLLREVDGAITVTRLGRSTRDSAQRLREQLDRLEAPMLGIVANGIKVRRGGKYGYGYYGGYYGPPEERQGAAERGGAAAGSSSGRAKADA